MANWQILKAAIAKVIKTNGNQEITGQVLQNVLNSIISSVGENSTFAGIATPTTNPGVPDGNIFYLAIEPGTYSNFDGIKITAGEVVILEWRRSWVKKISGFALASKVTELESSIGILGKYLDGCSIVPFSISRGYIDLSGTAINIGGPYFYTSFIKLEKGKKYFVAASGSSNTLIIAAYDTDSESSLNSELSLTGEGKYLQKIIIPKSDYYIRITINSSTAPLNQHGVVEIMPEGMVRELHKTSFLNLFKNGSECDLIPFKSGKFISYGNGTEGIGTTYNITEFSVKKGDRIKLIVGGSTSVAVIAAYKNGKYYKDLSIQGTGEKQEITYYVKDIDKVIITNNTAYLEKPKITYTVNELINGFGINEDSSAFKNKGYIENSTGEIKDGGYSYTDLLDVNVGSLIVANVRASGSVSPIALYSDDGAYIDSVKGVEYGGEMHEYYYVVNNSAITKARICTNNQFKSESKLKILNNVPASILSETTNSDDKTVPNMGLVKNLCKDYTFKKRKAVFAFIFDDGESNDEIVKNIFDEYGLKCGFAIYKSNKRYKNFYDEGFEILAHAESPISNPNEENVRNMLQTAYNKIIYMGIDCKGWVTPSSALDSKYQPLVYDYYEYGFTIYKGSATKDVGIPNTQKTYQLWRSSIESLTTEQCKAIIDSAVANSQLIIFYAHPRNLNTGANNLTTAHIKEIIEYCKDKGYGILTPYDAIRCYFTIRKNEDSFHVE